MQTILLAHYNRPDTLQNMATKRPAPDVHPSRQQQVPEESSRKRRKTNPTPHSQPKLHPVNPIKSRIRSVQRLLNHNEDLPADVRIGHERELQSLQWDLEQAIKVQRRTEMIGRYHKIRFFDRQKATKRLKKVTKALATCEDDADEKDELEKKQHESEVDLNYALYYPLDQAYVSLFPTRKKSGEEAAEGDAAEESAEGKGEIVSQGDRKMWALVEKCMTEGSLDALRNGKINLDGPAKAPAAPVVNSKPKAKPRRDGPTADVHGTRRERRAAKAQQKEEDDDSEGGFFE